MKHYLCLFAACFVLFLAPGLLQAQLPQGMSVTCDDGTSFENGVEVSIYQLRTGFTYTATAIGLNGFDPVLAVLDANTGEGLCNDDSSDALSYAADLPTTGSVPSSNLSAQVTFNQNAASNFADVSLVVGGYGNQSGEFVLILEGMGVTSGDGAGDAFSVNITPGMVESGVPLSIYMITRGQSELDPFIYQSDSSLNAITDNAGKPIGCDDAGNADLCSGESYDLSDYSVTLASGNLPGWELDAMLSLPLEGLSLNSDPTQNYYTFVMTSSPQNVTEGQYLLVFDIGTIDASDSNGGGLSGGQETQNNSGSPTQVPQTNNTGAPQGMSVTCDDGTTFDNGVEIIVNQMRAGFTYTATAVGLNGFDPVLAVLDTSTGEGLCSDDTNAASVYEANLPTTGFVPSSSLSSQVTFNQNSSSTFANVSLVVGGYGNQSGEFLLILEGMASTAEDNAGDVFDVNITPGMVASGVPLTIYMITRGDSELDPYIVETDASLNAVIDSAGDTIACDDAGNSDLCWGNSTDLSNSTVTLATGSLPGWEYDALLSLDISGMRLNNDLSQNYLTFVMTTSPQNQTEGQYLLVFHIGETD